jgi:drug/metabolite transporter, DME family
MKPGYARLNALAAALLFSTGGAAIKVDAFSAAQVSMLRSGIAVVVLYSWYRRDLRWTSWTPIAGLVYAATLTLFVAATKLTTAANAIFLQSAAPLYIVVLGPWLLRERASRGDLAYLAAMAGGMAFCFFGAAEPTATAPDPASGNLIAIASGVAWALTLISLRHLNRAAGPGPGGEAGIAAVVAGNGIACLIAAPWALPMPAAGAAEWGSVMYLGTVQVALAYVFLTNAMRRLPALEISLLLLIEPVLNPFWTWLVHGERPGAWTMVGGAVILGATALRTVVRSDGGDGAEVTVTRVTKGTGSHGGTGERGRTGIE